MDNKKKASKGLVVLLAILIVMLVAVSSVALGLYFNSKHSEGGEDVMNNQISYETNALPRYEIINVEKVNDGMMLRFSCDVLIREEVAKVELIAIGEEVTKKIIEERRGFQALAINFYTDEELLKYPPALGNYIYAPNGKWEDAGEGKANFENFKADPTGLMEKDWELRPTNREVEIYEFYSNFEIVDDGVESAAIEYGISLEEAKDCIDKITKWIYR